MDTRSIGQALRWKGMSSAGLRQIARAVVVCGVGLLLLVSLIILSRRAVGALLVPLSPAMLLSIGGIGGLAAWLLRIVWQSQPAPEESQEDDAHRLDLLVAWGPSLALALAALALTIPGTSIPILILFWSILIASELVALRHLGILGDGFQFRVGIDLIKRAAGHPPDQLDQEPTSMVQQARKDQDMPESSLRSPAGSLQAAEEDEEDSSLVLTQQLTRATDLEGCDVLFGTVWAEFEPGSRDTNVHVAFCPPFTALPFVEVEQADGPNARIKVAHVIPTGVRLETRLSASAQEPTRVAIELSVRAAESTD